MEQWKEDLQKFSLELIKGMDEEGLVDLEYNIKMERLQLDNLVNFKKQRRFKNDLKIKSYQLNRVQEQIGIYRRRRETRREKKFIAAFRASHTKEEYDAVDALVHKGSDTP